MKKFILAFLMLAVFSQALADGEQSCPDGWLNPVIVNLVNNANVQSLGFTIPWGSEVENYLCYSQIAKWCDKNANNPTCNIQIVAENTNDPSNAGGATIAINTLDKKSFTLINHDSHYVWVVSGNTITVSNPSKQ